MISELIKMREFWCLILIVLILLIFGVIFIVSKRKSQILKTQQSQIALESNNYDNFLKKLKEEKLEKGIKIYRNNKYNRYHPRKKFLYIPKEDNVSSLYITAHEAGHAIDPLAKIPIIKQSIVFFYKATLVLWLFTFIAGIITKLYTSAVFFEYLFAILLVIFALISCLILYFEYRANRYGEQILKEYWNFPEYQLDLKEFYMTRKYDFFTYVCYYSLSILVTPIYFLLLGSL